MDTKERFELACKIVGLIVLLCGVTLVVLVARDAIGGEIAVLKSLSGDSNENAGFGFSGIPMFEAAVDAGQKQQIFDAIFGAAAVVLGLLLLTSKHPFLRLAYPNEIRRSNLDESTTLPSTGTHKPSPDDDDRFRGPTSRQGL